MRDYPHDASMFGLAEQNGILPPVICVHAILDLMRRRKPGKWTNSTPPQPELNSVYKRGNPH